MIQSVLLFILGFLSAGLLALLLLPAVWSRAVGLTRRGIEAALPTTLEEINARADQMRAQFAVDLRKVELQRDDAARKAASLMVETGRRQSRFDRAQRERSGLKEKAAGLEQELVALRAAVADRDRLVSELVANSTQAEDLLAERTEALDRLRKLYEETAVENSAHEVEAAARLGEVEELSRELARFTHNPSQAAAIAPRATDGAAEIADLRIENARLMAELASVKQASLRRDKTSPNADSELRETMLELAAEVVRQTAREPEQAAAIDQALAKAPSGPAGRSTVISLADRIRRKRPDRPDKT